MDSAAKPDEVRLRKGSSLSERLIWAGSGALVLLIVIPGLVNWASGGPPLPAAFWAVPLGLFLIGVAVLERNIAWIVTQDGILIGEQRPFGQVHKRLIDRRDIVDVRIRKNRFSYPAGFSLACTLASGGVLISPPLPDITRVNETSARIARLLGRPDAAPVDNPLDADNAEITLGSPASAEFGRVIRMVAPVLAGLCAVPFFVAFWIGEWELALGLLLPLSLIIATALYRYAHRLSGAFWIIRHGEIRIERIALNGQPSADTIRADDVAEIEIDRPSTKSRTFNIRVRLRTGQTFRSPTRYDENGALAVRAEIIRRLNMFTDEGEPAG